MVFSASAQNVCHLRQPHVFAAGGRRRDLNFDPGTWPYNAKLYNIEDSTGTTQGGNEISVIISWLFLEAQLKSCVL